MNIVEIKNQPENSLVHPSFIYNRLDKVAERYTILQAEYKGRIYTVSIFLEKTAYMGIWLMDIPSIVVDEFCKFVFDHYNYVKRIEYSYSKEPHGVSWPGVHYKIDLPDTEEDLNHRLSKKSRYNTKREKDILERTFGGYIVEEYESHNCPENLIEHYFYLKSKTHITDYDLAPADYIKKYHVSNVYVLKMGDIIGAILFSCEQFQDVYIENLTYDEKYAKYSCGKALYDIVLKRLIQKGKKTVFLGGGNLDYKKKYGSIMEDVYNGYIYRSKTTERYMRCKLIIKKYIKKIIGKQ